MNLQTMKQRFKTTAYDDLLISITQTSLDLEKQRILDLIDQCLFLYGEGDYHLFSSPARAELIGNHCDHQHGQAIAATINRDMLALVKANDASLIQLSAPGFDLIVVDGNDVSKKEEERHTSESIIKGLVAFMKQMDNPIVGFVGCLHSNIPIGSGCSSSAAFEVLMATILNQLNSFDYTPTQLALLAQRSENEYYGKPCGCMDQMSISHGGCLAFDFHSLDAPSVFPLDFDFQRFGYRCLLVNTPQNHANLSNDYASIPFEMKTVANRLGQEVLGDCQKRDFLERFSSLDLLNDRALLRSWHYFDEIERVDAMIHAIEHQDIQTVLACMQASGRSSLQMLQNIYHDPREQALTLVLTISEIFLKDQGIVRIHGGGFAGCIQVIVKEEYVKAYCEMMSQLFPQNSTMICDVRAKGACLIIE